MKITSLFDRPAHVKALRSPWLWLMVAGTIGVTVGVDSVLLIGFWWGVLVLAYGLRYSNIRFEQGLATEQEQRTAERRAEQLKHDIEDERRAMEDDLLDAERERVRAAWAAGDLDAELSPAAQAIQDRRSAELKARLEQRRAERRARLSTAGVSPDDLLTSK